MNPKKNFIQSLDTGLRNIFTPPKASSSVTTPRPTVASSNAGATSTQPTKITTPKLPPSGQQFVSNLSNVKPTDAPLSPYNPTGGIRPPETDQSSNTQTKAPSATDTAFAAYIESLKPSDKVTKAKTAYNDYVANANLGIKNIEGQGRGIPLSLVRGQQAKLADQAEIEAKRLQGDIGIASDTQTASQNVAKAKLDFEQGKASGTGAPKPFAVGDQTYQYNPETGQYENKGSNQITTSAATGFTLSPGENRYDANGKLIASGGPKPLTQTQETAALAKTEKETAAQQSATQSIGIVNNLLNGDRYKAISGATQTGSIPFFGDRTAVNEYDQLQGLLKLGIRGLLKGQGAISDYEGKVLGQAASSLSRLTSESQMKDALQKVRGVLKTNNGQTTSVNVTNPQTGETINGAELSGAEIYHLVSEGNVISYN